jgi:hypothetical protein
MKEVFYKMLSLVQRFKPSTKFIFVGDFNQYEPVLDRVGEKPKDYYSESNIFHELTNGNILRLTKFRRGDEKHFEFVKNSSNVKTSDYNNSIDTDFHLCYTNKKE